MSALGKTDHDTIKKNYNQIIFDSLINNIKNIIFG